MDIVSDLGLIAILQAQALLVKLAHAIDALANVVIVNECLRRVVRRELEKQDSVAFVLHRIRGRHVHCLRRALLLLSGLLHFCNCSLGFGSATVALV